MNDNNYYYMLPETPAVFHARQHRDSRDPTQFSDSNKCVHIKLAIQLERRRAKRQANF